MLPPIARQIAPITSFQTRSSAESNLTTLPEWKRNRHNLRRSSTGSTGGYITLDTNEKAPSPDFECRYQQWTYRYPRLSFFILMIGFALASSALGTYYCTLILLSDVLPVSQALKTARTEYFATTLVLDNMTHCVQNTVLPTLIHTKAVIDNETLTWQNQVNAVDAALSTASTTSEQCLDATLNAYEAQLASTGVDQAQLSCLNDGVVRARAMKTDGSMIHQVVSARLSAAFLTATARVYRAETKIFPLSKVDRAASLVQESTASWWNDLKQSIVSDLIALTGMLDVNVDSETTLLLDALGEGDMAEDVTDGGIQLATTIKTKLYGLLKSIPRVHHDVETAVNTADKAWAVVLQTLTINQALTNRLHDLVNVTNTTALHVMDHVDKATDDLKTVFERSMMGLLQTVDHTVDETLDTALRRWNEILDKTSSRLQLETTQPRSYRRNFLLSRNETDPFNMIKPLKSPNNNTAIRPIPQNKSWRPLVPDTTLEDVVFQGSIFETISTWLLIYLIFDLLRVIGSLLRNGLELVSDNLSYLNPVDIRELAEIQTFSDIRGVFQGRFDMYTVVYAFINQGCLIMAMILRVVMWSVFEIVGTAVFVAWKEEYLTTCSGTAVVSAMNLSETTPWGFFLLGVLIPNVTTSVISPWTEYEQAIINQQAFIGNTTADLTRSLQDIWKVQAQQVQEIMDERRVALVLDKSLLNCTRGAVNTTLTGSCPLTMSMETESTPYKNTTIIKERLVNALQADTSITKNTAVCLTRHSTTNETQEDDTIHHQTIQLLEYRQYCAREKALYLSLASWWIWLTLYRLLHTLSHLLIRAVGLLWWRYLSRDRVTFLGFCFEDGRMDLNTSEDLGNAVRRQLRDIRWRVGIRVVCTLIVMILASVVVYMTLYSMI